MGTSSTTWILNYESKTHVFDSKTSASFSIRIRGLERTLVQSPSGLETLVSQTNMGVTDAIVSEIPPAFLGGEEICSRYLATVLSKQNINSWTQHRIIPNICKDAIDMRRRLGQEETKGFLVEAQVEAVKETWFKMFSSLDDDSDSQRIPIEQDCIICLEELSSGGQRTILKLPCSHNFHRGCILPWLRWKHSCPTCRDDIQNPRNVTLIYLEEDL